MELRGDQTTLAVVRPALGVDPRATERLLCDQEGVVEASVWLRDGELAAHVTVSDDSHWTVRELQAVCLNELGLHQTPRTLLLVQVRPTATTLRLSLAA